MPLPALPTTLTAAQDAFASSTANPSSPSPSLPALALLSSATEVQKILAAFPLLAIGLVGLAVAAIQLSEGRLNRISLNLFLACVAAFVGGILQNVNASRWEYLGPEGMSGGLIIAQGISLAFFLAFKLFYLYRRSESREAWSVVDDVVRVVSWVAILATSVMESVWRSGFRVSVTRFRGVYFPSNALQLVFLLFFGAKLLHLTMNDVDRPRAKKLLAVAPLLLGILLGAIVALISLVPSLLQFSETPLGRFLLLVEMYIFLLELAILDHRQSARASLSCAISPSFVDDAALRDAEQRSIAEREGEEMTETPTAISGITIRRGSTVPSWYKTRSTLVREREWAGGDEDSLTLGAAPPGEVGHTLRGLVAAKLASEGIEWSGPRFEEEEGLGESSFEFPESVRESNASSQRAVVAQGGGGAVVVANRRDGGVREGASPLVRPRARPRGFVHSPEPSTWSNNLRFSHLDSSIFDLGLDSIGRPSQVRPTSLEPENRPLTRRASRVDLPPRPPPPPFDTPMPPVPPLRITYNHAREDSAATVRGLRPVVEAGTGRSGGGGMQMEAYAFPRPSCTSVSAGKVEHGGRLDAETQRGRGGESTSSSAECTASSDWTDLDAARYSSTSGTTNTSSLTLSLSHFPRPPTCPPARPSFSSAGSDEGGTSRSSAYSTMTGSSVHAHRHLVAVARDGSEFELLPPSGMGEAIGAGGGGGAGGLDITSLIVSEECKAQAEKLRRELAGWVSPRRVPAAVEGDEVGGAALVEDLEGEAVVRQASVRSRKGGVMPAGGSPTPHGIRHDVPVHRPVDAASGAIPSQLHEGSGDGYISSLASLDGGLPSDPRPRLRPRPLPIILPPHGHPYHARFHVESSNSATSTTYVPLRPFEQPRAPPKRPTLGMFREGERGVRVEEEKRVERLREGVGGTRGKEGKGWMGGFGRGGSGRP